MTTLNKKQYLLEFTWLTDKRKSWVWSPPLFSKEKAIRWLKDGHMFPQPVWSCEVVNERDFELPEEVGEEVN